MYGGPFFRIRYEIECISANTMQLFVFFYLAVSVS